MEEEEQNIENTAPDGYGKGLPDTQNNVANDNGDSLLTTQNNAAD